MKKYFSLILLSVMTLLPNTSHAFFPWINAHWWNFSTNWGIQYGWDPTGSGLPNSPCCAGAYTATNPNNGTSAMVLPAGLFISEASGPCVSNGIPCVSIQLPKGENLKNMSKATKDALEIKMREAGMGADLRTAKEAPPALSAALTSSSAKVISTTGFVKNQQRK